MKKFDRLKQEMLRMRSETEELAEMARERIDLFATGLIAKEELEQVLQVLYAKRIDYDKTQRDYLAQVPY